MEAHIMTNEEIIHLLELEGDDVDDPESYASLLRRLAKQEGLTYAGLVRQTMFNMLEEQTADIEDEEDSDIDAADENS